MDKMKTAHLTELISRLATDMADIQKQMDDHFEKEIQRFKKLVSQTPDAGRAYLVPLAPKRQRISKHEVSARMSWQYEKSKAGGIHLKTRLLNFSADLRYQRNTEQDSHLEICIEQIPANLQADQSQ